MLYPSRFLCPRKTRIIGKIRSPHHHHHHIHIHTTGDPGCTVRTTRPTTRLLCHSRPLVQYTRVGRTNECTMFTYFFFFLRWFRVCCISRLTASIRCPIPSHNPVISSLSIPHYHILSYSISYHIIPYPLVRHQIEQSKNWLDVFFGILFIFVLS